MMYRWMQEETARLRIENADLLDFLNVIQVTLSHLVQDGNLNEQGIDSVNSLLVLLKEYQDKYESTNK